MLVAFRFHHGALVSMRLPPCVMPGKDQEVTTKLGGSGKEGDSPSTKAAEMLMSYILQVLETHSVLGKFHFPLIREELGPY